MKKSLFSKIRFVFYIFLLCVISWLLFNFLLNKQSTIMYRYFIEKPAGYNLERAERLSSSIYQSFKSEVTSPTIDNIHDFISKYNDIPFLSVNFIYRDNDGTMQSVLNNVKEIDILNAEYVYPIKSANTEIGTLLIYDINKEYKKGLQEYSHMLYLTRIFFAILLLLLLGLLLYREYSTKIEQQKRIAEYQAVHDGLTGLHTHKYFKDLLEHEIGRSKRYKHPLSLIMCDIDHFKQFNDTLGHLAGDKAIQIVAGIITANVRTSDIVARYGGEEFAVLLLETGFEDAKNIAKRLKTLTDQAVEIASRIKNEVSHTPLKIGRTENHITLSMGVASYDGHEDYKSEYLISEADHALYESKDNGRNLITLFNPETKKFERYA